MGCCANTEVKHEKANTVNLRMDHPQLPLGTILKAQALMRGFLARRRVAKFKKYTVRENLYKEADGP